MSVNYLCRQFHTLLNEKKFEDINNQIISKYDFNYLTSLENNSLISLLLQYGIYSNNEDIINKVLPYISRRRDYFHYIMYNKENVNLCRELFLKNISFDSILPKDIEFLINNDLKYLVKLLDGRFIKMDTVGKLYPEVDFKRYKFEESKKYFDSIASKVLINNFMDTIIDKNYNYIIDAGNILFSRNGELTDFSVIDLNYVINKFSNSLIIIHSKHLKNNKIKKILSDKLFFATPYKYNDDIFTIMAYLYNNCKIITNDTFKDHTIENNNFRNFIFDDLIKYSNYNGVITFDIEYSYTRCIQVINEKIYVPANYGFLCFI